MKTEKILLGILIVSFLACNDSKKIELNSPPKIEFSLPNVSKNSKVDHTAYVNDLENLFTTDQIESLENYLLNLEKERDIKILILTIPSKENSTKEWTVENGFTTNGIIITISKSRKIVGIGLSKENLELSDKVRKAIIQDTIIPEFEDEKYYFGIKKGIEAILKY